MEEVLAGYTARNSTTKQDIQEKIDTALINTGISGVTVTVRELVKTEATTDAVGSVSGSITIVSDNDSSVTDSVSMNKTIEKLPETDAEKVVVAKKVVEEALAGITVTGETTKDDIQRVIDTALTNAGITDVTVTVGEFVKTKATVDTEGSIDGIITIVSDNDSSVTDSVSMNKTIEKLPETDAEKVTAAKKIVEEALAGITATNETTKDDIQKVIDTALTNAGMTDVTATAGDIVKTEATTQEAGKISGTISIECGRETDSAEIGKTITKLPTTDAEKVEAAKKIVKEALAGITVTNTTTKQDIQKEIDTALTNAGMTDVTVTVGEFAGTEATTSEAGSIRGTISIECGSETDSVAVSKTIAKLPETDAEKVEAAKKIVKDVLAGITATNSTTEQDIQEKINTALEDAGITDVTVTVTEFDKTEATAREVGSISGSIVIKSENDSSVTGSVTMNKTIAKLPDTDDEKVALAKSVVKEVLAGITITNETTREDIQREIDEALEDAGITDVVVTVEELTKTEATTEEAGSVSGSITIESENDPDATDSVPVIKTIEKLPETDAQKVAKAKKIVEDVLAGITEAGRVTKEDIQREIDEALTNAGITDVIVTVGELAKTEATTDAAGSVSGSITIVSANDSDVTDSVPIIKTIAKLPETDAQKVANTKKIVEDVLAKVLAEITAAGDITREDIQREIDEALEDAGITDVVVTVEELTKTEATTDAAGSVSGSITIGCGSATDTVPISKTITQISVHTHTWIWVITKPATADEEGEMTGTCICGEVTTEEIPKTGESGTVIVKEDAENECNGSLADKEDVKGKVSLTDMEKEQLNAGEDLVIILRLRDLNEAVDTQDKAKIMNKLWKTNTLGTFLDIELLKQIGDKETKIAETRDEIKITFEIPKHLWNTDDTVTRTYQIARNHDGMVDILNVENYDEAAHLLTFKTDKFSTYALLYRDTAKNQTPITGVIHDQGDVIPETALTENALSLNALLKVSQAGKKINIAWGKVAGADGYDVYVQYCSKKFTTKSITAIKSGETTKVSVKKVNGKKLKQKKNYKVYVLAYKLVNGKKVTLGKTIIAHIVGSKNTKYTNVKEVKVKKTSYSLKKGKTVKIQASTVLVNKDKKQLTNAHAKEFRYASTDKKVAKVSAKGKIKAVGKGKCTIYVYARNGYAKKINVKVK